MVVVLRRLVAQEVWRKLVVCVSTSYLFECSVGGLNPRGSIRASAVVADVVSGELRMFIAICMANCMFFDSSSEVSVLSVLYLLELFTVLGIL